MSDSQKLYEALLTGTNNAKRQRALKNIWGALEHLRTVKSKDFSCESVARAITALTPRGEKPTPKAQSIRNEADLKGLVKAYEREFGPALDGRPVSVAEDVLTSISDLRARAMVEGVLRENAVYKRRLDLLKDQFKRLAPVEVATLVLGEPPGPSLPRPTALPETTPALPAPSSPALTPIEVAAVATLLERIQEHGPDLELTFDESGALLWREGVLEMSGAGLYDALRKVVASHTE